jgi:POT family proton-dependent oligopeptide transporter
MAQNPSDASGPGKQHDSTIGHQPTDVEEIRFGRGPGEHEMGPPDTTTGHPKGLWVLFITEMWERFSYYGMRALLVLFLATSSAPYLLPSGQESDNVGFGWTESEAYVLYGVYTFMVYLTSIFGGIAADRFLGTHRSMLYGGWIIALGHITLTLTELFSHVPGEPVSMETGPGQLVTFLLGLTLIIIGTGFFKPCVSVMVGQLYGEGDPRRDSGFTIFYMGINLGAFLSPLIAGTLGETVGWHWGFGAAAVGMVLGLVFYQIFRPRYLEGVGEPPEGFKWSGKAFRTFAIVTGLLVAIPVIPLILYISGGLGAVVTAWNAVTGPLGTYGTAAIITALILAGVVAFLMSQPGTDRGPLAVILILAFLGNIFFWTAFEQAGSSMNIFARDFTDRSLALPEFVRDYLGNPSALTAIASLVVGAALIIPAVLRLKKKIPTGFLVSALAWIAAGLGAIVLLITAAKFYGVATNTNPLQDLADMRVFPATWYQSVNALTIVICAPIFSVLWVWLARRRMNPSTPMKFAIGLWLLGLAFIAMVFGAMQAEGEGNLAGPHWLIITYVVYTWGELCLSPVGLSMVTKLAPKRLQSLMMGLWFFSLALSNLLAGLVATFSEKIESGEMTFIIEGLPGFYLMLVLFPIGAGLLIALLTPILKKMMKGRG